MSWVENEMYAIDGRINLMRRKYPENEHIEKMIMIIRAKEYEILKTKAELNLWKELYKMKGDFNDIQWGVFRV